MNDLIYNELVATPGYEIEFAVGTTYSMDAEAFLAVAMSMTHLGEADEMESPVRLLEGIRQANRRVAIFINRGGLQPPMRKNPLYAMLDKCVFEVSDERRGKELANFHPKLWIIREHAIDNASRRQIKLIVLSRNLTKDSSLDIAVSMVAPLDVHNSETIRQKHAPLKDLLFRLADYATGKKRKDVIRLAKDIDKIGAFEIDSQYEDYDFLPIHFGENLNTAIDFRKELPGTKMAVVSPFVDLPTLEWLNNYGSTSEKILITRLESLTPEIMNMYAGEKRQVWVPSMLMANNDVIPMDLHAKMYFSWGPRTGGIHLWLGSANATKNGFYRNSELLLRLSLKRGRNQFENFVREFIDEKKQMFQQVTKLPDHEDPKDTDLSLGIAVRTKLISRNNLSAEICSYESGYTIHVQAKRLKDIPATIKIAPVQEQYNESELTISGCDITVHDAADLSEFYILTALPFDKSAELVKMVIKIPTKGIPEDRDNIIFRSLINTPDKFLAYVEMVITDRPMELMSILDAHEGIEQSLSGQEMKRHNALYESLLRIAATNPAKLEDIQEIVSMAGDNIVPDSFRRMASVFNRYAKKLR